METPGATDRTEKDNPGQSEGNEDQRRRGKVFQMLACLIANTSVLGPAMGLGYSAVALGPLASPESDIKVSYSQQSWIASVTAIATPIGCVLSSVAMRRGRRFGIVAPSFVSAVGWLAIYFASDVKHILAGRAITGVSIGLASVPAIVYSAEVAAPKLRGIVVTWTSVAIAIGILIVYILGYVFPENWRLVALLCGVFPVLSTMLIAIRMPESPRWLRSSGRSVEAEDALRSVNGIRNGDETPDYLLAELDSIGPGFKNRDLQARGALFRAENLKPFFVMLGYFFFQQFSGTFVVIYYAVDFTLEAGVRMDGHLAAILIGITRLFGTIGVSYVSRKYGRRIPSIISGTGMTLFMGILSLYLWVSSRGYGISDHGVIPVVSILMYILMSTMGFLVLPFAMIGEIYPARVKDVLSGLTTCLAYVFSFFILKIYPDMLKSLDKHGVFLFYALFSFAGTIFVWLFLPETKGKTLQEIEDLFVKKTKKKKQKVTPKVTEDPEQLAMIKPVVDGQV